MHEDLGKSATEFTGPTVVCAGLKESVIEDLSIIKVVLDHHLCIYVLVLTSKFTIYLLCLLQFIMKCT